MKKWLILGAFITISSAGIYANFGKNTLLLHLASWVIVIGILLFVERKHDN